MSKQSRLKLTWCAMLFLVSTCYLSIAKDMETVATTCIAGVMTVMSTYIWAETKRPSDKS